MKRTRVVVLVCFVFALILTSAGSVSADKMSSELTITNWDMDEHEPDVAYNSVHDEYFVVWWDNNGISFAVMAARYTAAGVFLGEYIIAYETNPVRYNAEPSVAYDPVTDEYFVVWSRDYWGNESDYDVYGRYVPWDGPDGNHPVFAIDGASGHQWDPRVAYNRSDNEFMVTWWNQSPAGSADNISALRFQAGGTAQGSVIIVTSDATQPRRYPDIAYNQARNEYVIAYQRGVTGDTDVYGVRLRANGEILGGGDFVIANWNNPEKSPRIAASRTSNTWAVAWYSEITVTDNDVFACPVWVDGTGTVQVGTPVSPGSSSDDENFPDISAHPESSNYLVTWEAEYLGPGGNRGIWSQVVTSAGTLGARFRPRELFIGESVDCTVPAVAGGVDDWMVVWQHRRDGTTYQDIHGRILFADVMADGFESGDVTAWSSAVP